MTGWGVSDDSLPEGLIAVYAIVQKGTPLPQMKHEEPEVFMTVFQGKSGPIVGTAKVNLYAGDPEEP